MTDPDEEKSSFSKSMSQKLPPDIGIVTKLMSEAEADDYEDEDDDESTLAGGNTMLQEEGDLWKTAWSQGRGVLNSDRTAGMAGGGGYTEEEADSSLPPVELSTMRKRRSRVRV